MIPSQYRDEIQHRGEVVDTPSSGMVKVRLSDASECSACAVASLCGIGGKKGYSILEVYNPSSIQLTKGDVVDIAGTERLHKKAIRLLTIYPTIAIIAVMVGVFLLTAQEVAAALSGLSVMVVFFLILWICRKKIATEFIFTIKRKVNINDSIKY